LLDMKEGCIFRPSIKSKTNTMQQAHWYKTQEADYCTLSGFKNLTRNLAKRKGYLGLFSEAITKISWDKGFKGSKARRKAHIKRLMDKRARTEARRERRGLAS